MAMRHCCIFNCARVQREEIVCGQKPRRSEAILWRAVKFMDREQRLEAAPESNLLASSL